MKATRVGIWMDHANAHIMEFTEDPIQTRTIESEFTHAVKAESIHKGEKRMHNKEQHQQAEYYNRLGSVIKDYEEVMLFGPTDAKVELQNILLADHHYEKIKIEIKQADKMTPHQQHAFVKAYFSALAKPDTDFKKHKI